MTTLTQMLKQLQLRRSGTQAEIGRLDEAVQPSSRHRDGGVSHPNVSTSGVLPLRQSEYAVEIAGKVADTFPVVT